MIKKQDVYHVGIFSERQRRIYSVLGWLKAGESPDPHILLNKRRDCFYKAACCQAPFFALHVDYSFSRQSSWWLPET